ncbi:hypothetical protein L218DRAFT_866579 [Marasmius fiardii PR-910]|nr:hypothetical protein L218DRAFT_866579 [Marasmius fiardii PR-910]
MQGITFQCWFDCRLDQTSYCRDRIWLSQAWSIFSMLNIPKDEWPDYSLADIIMLELKPLFSNHQGSKCDSIDPNKASNHLQSPCYLFLYPVPELSDGSPDINTWMSGKNLYYWSSDSDGKSVMPESQCVSLELPSFVPNVEYLTWNWNPDIYESIWAWQEAKGFDPTMTYFTCSLGYPIMDVISPNMDDHFKVLSEDASMFPFT